MTATAAAASPRAQAPDICIPPPRTGATPRAARAYACGKDDYLRRLRKIEGQVRGLQKMIDADTWCPDVVIQVASATRALQEVAVGLLSDHLRHCVTHAAYSSPKPSARSGKSFAADLACTGLPHLPGPCCSPTAQAQQ